MNNEQKNTYVRKQMTDALLRMLKTRKLEDISVTELTDEAGVGRVSFYRNYLNIEDILKEESDRLIKQWGSIFQEPSSGTYNAFYLSMFDFFRKHKEFYTTLYDAGLSDIIMDTIVSSADINPETANLDAYLKSFWAYGTFGWLIEWIRRGMQESSTEIVRLFELAQVNHK